MDDVHRVLDLAVDAVTELRLDYAVVGGLAVAAWSSPRATRDVDLYVRLRGKELELERALRRQGFIVPAMRAELERFGVFRSRHAASGVFLDIFDADNPLGEAVLDRRRSLRIGRRNLGFVSPEDLAVLKAFSDRPRDMDDLISLLLPENGIDVAYVEDWARRLDQSTGGDEVRERLRQALASGGAARKRSGIKPASQVRKKPRGPRRR